MQFGTLDKGRRNSAGGLIFKIMLLIERYSQRSARLVRLVDMPLFNEGII
jgi:hypothetical protein